MPKSTAPRNRRRSAGEGSVYRAKDGRWRGAVTWTDPDGSRQRRMVSGRTSEEARRKLDDLRRELRLGTLTSGPNLTTGEYLTGWLERHRMKVRPSTWRVHESAVRNHLIPIFGRTPLVRLTAADVERAMARMLVSGRRPQKPGRTLPLGVTSLSPVSVRHIRATLRAALFDAMEAGLVVRNAAADADPPYLPYQAIRYLTGAEVGRLLDGTAGDEYGPAYCLAATLGLRRGELLGLKWGDISDGVLTVSRSMVRGHDGFLLGETKTDGSRRQLPLPARTRQALEVQRARQDAAREAAGSAWQGHADLIFTDKVGRPTGPEALSARFRQARDRLGLPPVQYRDLRHSAATVLLANGVPLSTISKWLGHANINMTMAAYAAIVPQLLGDAADAMDRALGS